MVEVCTTDVMRDTLVTPITRSSLLGEILLGRVRFCKGNLTDLRRILHLSLAKGNPK
jgi:hypothetical protein